MKIFKFLVLLSFFMAFTTTFVHAIDADVVTDVDGNELRSTALYVIEAPFVSVIPSMVGPDYPSCPAGTVVLDFSKRCEISITPLNSNSTLILEDTYVTVRFKYSYPCGIPISLVWKIGPGGFVRTGGIEGIHRFKITKYGVGFNMYQLAACPVSECLNGCTCEPVGYVVKGGVSYLVAGGDPLPILFILLRLPTITDKLPSM